MAQLAHPPGLPSPLEGILNRAGVAVPVLRLDRLLQLPLQRPGLYSMLILLKGASEGGVALLVDRVSEVLTVAESALLPVGEQHSFNGCAEAAVLNETHMTAYGAVPIRSGIEVPFFPTCLSIQHHDRLRGLPVLK